MSDLTPQAQFHDDEIDLFELISDLWAEKWVIAVCIVITTACALAYAFASTPAYEATARLMPPSQSDVTGYNVGRLTLASMGNKGGNSETLPQEYKPEDVYDVFKSALLSQQVRNRFFEDHYLPYLGIKSDSGSLEHDARDQLQQRFSNILSVSQPSARGLSEYYQVRVELKDPALAAEWANLFVEMAAKRAEQQVLSNVLVDLRSRASITKEQLLTLEVLAKQQREDRIVRLRESLQIARALGLEDSLINAGRTNADSELAALVEGDLMYLRGTRALQAELEVLQARTNDTPFIEDYRALQTRAQVLDSVVIDETKVAVYTLDSPAEAADTPIKPKKPMILALGIVLGGMLGGMIALVRIVIRKRKQAQKLA